MSLGRILTDRAGRVASEIPGVHTRCLQGVCEADEKDCDADNAPCCADVSTPPADGPLPTLTSALYA